MWAHRLSAAQPRSAAFVGAAIAAAALAGTVAQLSHGVFGSQVGSGDLDWVGGALAVCSTLPLVASHRAPRAVFILTAGAGVLLGATGDSIAVLLGPTAALYLLAASRDEHHPWTRHDTDAVLAFLLAYLAAAALGDESFPGSALVHTGMAWAVAWFAGERTRLRHAHVAELQERAIRAERESESERRLAAAEERARIARDLHDSAGHAINVIALRAGTARLRKEPERSQAALEAIEELARKTVDEIDHIVGALRDRGSANGAVEAPPGLASLDTLVARHAAAGLDISVEREGAPRELETAVDQAAYRILQEALTNAFRHGTGSARVELDFGDAALELTISNPAPARNGARASGGHGLIGMRERARLLGGNLDTDGANGTFRVHAELPYEGPRH